MPPHLFTSRLLLLLVIGFSAIGQAFGQQIPMPRSLLELQHSPAPYECAVLSAHAYKEDLQQGDPVVWVDPNTQQVHALHGWAVYKILTEDSEEPLSKAFQQLGLPYGYRGVLYMNARKKQLVLAHRGTELKNMSAIKTDVYSIAQNVIGGQERIIPLLLDEAITIAQQEKYSLTVTGHSLGGWLAQITAFIAKDQYPEHHVKAIAFDSPGAQPMLEQIKPRNNPIPLDQLDITNYLSSPNLINACNHQIGTVYRVVFEQFNTKQSSYTLQSHTMKTLIRAFNPNTGDAYQTLCVHSWPLVAKKSLDLTGQLITGDKLNTILALCQILKRCINQESLGEYSGFFKFANKVNRYHPQPYTKEGKDSFDLNYKYHYNTKPFIPSQLHIRHFPAPAQQFLRKMHAGTKPYIKVAAQDQLIQAIAWNQQTGWVHIDHETDLRLVGDQLLSTVLAHPELEHTAGLNTPLLHASPLLAPPTVSFFVGREQAIKDLNQCFQGIQEYILAPTITGPGGIGKTQLALRVVKQQAQEAQYDHVFWIPAESEKKLIDAYLRIAEGLDIYVDGKDLKQAVQTVRTYLQKRHCLYVFDDAPDIGMLRDFLPLSKGHVLITSKNSAKEDWDNKPIQMNPLSEQEALTLAQTFGFSQQPSTQESLKSLLAKVPRYPLTLQQLFSTLEKQGIGPQEFLTAMQHYTVDKEDQVLLDLLSEHPHARLGYDKSILYVFKASLEQLAQAAQGHQALQLLSQLGYLDPKDIPVAWLLTWDKEDTSPLRRKTREALALLEKYSLIQWDRATQQVYIHAETQLMVRHLHSQPYLTTLINKVVDYVGDAAEAPQNAAKWSLLLPHGRMLFERLATDQYPHEAYILTKYLADACRVAYLFKEGVSWAKKCLAITQKRYPDQDHTDVAYALNRVGVSLGEVGKLQEALEYKQEALAMRKHLSKDQAPYPDVAYSLSEIGSTLSQLGKHQEAIECFKWTLDIIKEEAPQNASKCLSLLLHGRMLFERLDNTQYPHEAYILTKYLADAFRVACLFKEGVSWAKKCLAIARKRYPDQDHPDVADALNSVGVSLGEIGHHQEALKYKQEALGMRKRLFKDQDHHPDVAYSLSDVGSTLSQLGKHQEALECKKKSLKLKKYIFGEEDHPEVAHSLNSIGELLSHLGEHEEALQYTQEGLAMRKRLLKDRNHPDKEKDHSDVARSLNSVGISLEDLGKLQEALDYKQEALAMYQRLFKNQDHPRLGSSLNDVGENFIKLGNPEEGLGYCREALALSKRLYPEQDHLQVAYSLNSIGVGLTEIDKAQEGLEHSKDALAMLKRLYPEREHPYMAPALNNIGVSLQELGSHQEALGYLKQALDMSKRLYQEQDHPWTSLTLHNIGKTLACSGNYQEALAYSQKALAMQKRVYQGQDHPYLAETLHSMGEALEGLGKLTEALDAYTKALCMALRIYKKEHPHITQYLNHLSDILSKVEDQTLIQQTKKEVLPLCNQWLGEKHALTQQLYNAGK